MLTRTRARMKAGLDPRASRVAQIANLGTLGVVGPQPRMPISRSRALAKHERGYDTGADGTAMRRLPIVWLAPVSKRSGAVALIDEAGARPHTRVSSRLDDRAGELHPAVGELPLVTVAEGRLIPPSPPASSSPMCAIHTCRWGAKRRGSPLPPRTRSTTPAGGGLRHLRSAKGERQPRSRGPFAVTESDCYHSACRLRINAVADDRRFVALEAAGSDESEQSGCAGTETFA